MFKLPRLPAPRLPQSDGYTVLRAEEVSEAIDRGLDRILTPNGFSRVQSRRWIRPRSPFHDVIEFEPLKGAQYAPVWGVSVDFVPSARRKLNWKRTPKSAELDVRLTIGKGELHRLWVGWIARGSRDELLSAAERAASLSARMAIEELKSVQSLADVADAFKQQMRTPVRDGLGPTSYLQTLLAYPLVLIATGETVYGDGMLVAVCDQLGIQQDDPILLKARAAAIATAG